MADECICYHGVTSHLVSSSFCCCVLFTAAIIDVCNGSTGAKSAIHDYLDIVKLNIRKMPCATMVAEQASVLRGHSGMVKGVTWDPIGKYLASQSDDRTARIWRTYSWKAEAVIDEPFKEVCVIPACVGVPA